MLLAEGLSISDLVLGTADPARIRNPIDWHSRDCRVEIKTTYFSTFAQPVKVGLVVALAVEALN